MKRTRVSEVIDPAIFDNVIDPITKRLKETPMVETKDLPPIISSEVKVGSLLPPFPHDKIPVTKDGSKVEGYWNLTPLSLIPPENKDEPHVPKNITGWKTSWKNNWFIFEPHVVSYTHQSDFFISH